MHKLFFSAKANNMPKNYDLIWKGLKISNFGINANKTWEEFAWDSCVILKSRVI